MSVIGEAIVNSSVNLLIKKLASSELLSFARQERIQADLSKWEYILQDINAVLQDAEEKQISKQLVKKWLLDLKDLAYDVEDILDEFATVALERKLSRKSEASTSKVGKLIPSSLNPRSIRFNIKMGSEMKKITERLQEMAARKNNLELRENSEGRSNEMRDQRLPTTSLNEAHVYGRGKDQEAIIEMLLKDDGIQDGISVIPIVGIGGVGKTTLAQNVYNDARVKSHFDLKAWACVSNDFDVIRITQAILQLIAPETRDYSDLNKLQNTLKEKLLGKKFLVVLDDIWNENPNKWKILLRPFESNSPGGKIIITTRSSSISSMVSTGRDYTLEVLSNDDCLSIFNHHSLGIEEINEHPVLKEIGEKIGRRCKGLPLAAKTLGGLLHNNINRNDWEQLLNSKMWNLPTEKSDIMPALRLSYYYLLSHLKPCFAYCSLLPKDYEFQKEEIILLWMAHDLLQQNDGTEEQMEDLGDHYFRELQSRSLFQQSNNNTSRYVMHDLINDLAQCVAGEKFFFRLENRMEGNKQTNVSKNIRHLSYVSGDYDGIKRFEAFYGIDSHNNLTYNGGLYDGVKMFNAFNYFKHLRTFLPLTLANDQVACNLTSDILNIFPKLRFLRILSLNRYYNITKLSDAIGDLKLLRYLDLSRTTIDVLPESINRLYNLQTLKLEYCYRLKRLCRDMGNLIMLRYLNTYATGLEWMPLNIGKATSLRTLSNFVVGRDVGSGLKELKMLKYLQTIRISGLQNIKDATDAKDAELGAKKNLTALFLEWSIRYESRNERIEVEVLHMLQPYNGKLEKLTISGYGGTTFPTWVGNTSFSNLVSLSFEGCSNCTALPSVGQLPSLKELYIRHMSGIKKLGLDFYGNGCSRPFQKLQILRFRMMAQWEEWEEWISPGFGQEEGALAQLQELLIEYCPKLQGRLPKNIPLLKKLYIRNCGQLLASISKLPEDCYIEIDGCKQVEHRNMLGLNSLNPLLFSDIASHVFLIQQFRQGLSQVEVVKIVGYNEVTPLWHTGITSQQDVKDDFVCLANLPQAFNKFSFLTKICIANCPELVSFPEAGLPSQLKRIDIESCKALESLPDSWMNSSSLECLFIGNCDSLIYLARNQLPPNLKQLEVRSCNNLHSLMQEENNNSQTSISGTAVCPSSTSSLIKSELPATLEHIHISGCSNLALLSSSGNLPKALIGLRLFDLKIESVAKTFHNNTCLKSVSIWGCSSLVAFPDEGLPLTNLTELSMTNCGKLEALPSCMQQLNHLQWIVISSCSSLVSFPDGGLPSTSLTELIIRYCEKLKALPNNMHNLTSLQKLTIENCPGIKSFPHEDGFPTNLTSLIIRNLKFFKPLSEWGLQRLTSLMRLEIGGCSDVVSFPPEKKEIMLPTSLILLEITDFPDLKRISSAIQNLTSLEKLQLKNCPQLESFPKKGLPLSLMKLGICECPLLKHKCKQSRGKYWLLIAYIPYVYIES